MSFCTDLAEDTLTQAASGNTSDSESVHMVPMYITLICHACT